MEKIDELIWLSLVKGTSTLICMAMLGSPSPAFAVSDGDKEKLGKEIQKLESEDPEFAQAVKKEIQNAMTQGAIETGKSAEDMHREKTKDHDDYKRSPGSFELDNPAPIWEEMASAPFQKGVLGKKFLFKKQNPSHVHQRH